MPRGVCPHVEGGLPPCRGGSAPLRRGVCPLAKGGLTPCGGGSTPMPRGVYPHAEGVPTPCGGGSTPLRRGVLYHVQGGLLIKNPFNHNFLTFSHFGKNFRPILVALSFILLKSLTDQSAKPKNPIGWACQYSLKQISNFRHLFFKAVLQRLRQ